MHDHAWESTLLAVGLEPQLLVDNLLTASTQDATHRRHTPERYPGGPLFTEDRPWTASTGRSTRRRRSSAAAAEAPATSTSSGTTSTRASSSFNIRAHRSARPDGRPARTERRNLFRRRTATVRHRATTQVSLARGSPQTYSRVIQMRSALVLGALQPGVPVVQGHFGCPTLPVGRDEQTWRAIVVRAQGRQQIPRRPRPIARSPRRRMADVTNIRAPNTLSGSISSVVSALAVGRTMVTGSPWLPPNPDFTVEWRAHQRLVAVERHRFMRAEHPSRQMTAKRSSRYCVSP